MQTINDRLAGQAYARPLTRLFCLNGYTLAATKPPSRVMAGCNLRVSDRVWQRVRTVAYNRMFVMVQQLKAEIQWKVVVVRE